MPERVGKSTHWRVVQAAESERQFSATMIESMPGIIYFYDDQGQFLRWNRNFETVSAFPPKRLRACTRWIFCGSGEGHAATAHRGGFRKGRGFSRGGVCVQGRPRHAVFFHGAAGAVQQPALPGRDGN